VPVKAPSRPGDHDSVDQRQNAHIETWSSAADDSRGLQRLEVALDTSRRISTSPHPIDDQESADDYLDEDSDDDVREELRKLDEDFQKNLQRAKKVFYNRMDNLQRCQIEREAQHQKTLEKHEKERAEFEKRLAQEAEQQNKRIEQLQREWDRKRESLAQAKKRQAPKRHGSYTNGENSSVDAALENLESFIRGSNLSGPRHTRSVSSSSNKSASGGNETAM